MTNDSRRSSCPISCSLDVLGDKWTLLVVRDLLDGKSRFRDFEQSAEGIPTNILTERLRRLEQADLVARVPIDGSKRHAYELTSSGEALRPMLLALVAWGNDHLDDTWTPPTNYLQPGRDATNGV